MYEMPAAFQEGGFAAHCFTNSVKTTTKVGTETP